MLVRESYPPGVPCWIDTAQADPDAAAAFYAGLFGWAVEDQMPAEAPGRYLVATLEGLEVAAIGSQEGDAPPVPVWTTYIAVECADAAAEKVRAAAGAVLAEPFDVMEAGRMAVCADPAGAVFCVWQAGTTTGAKLVNHPGTWNWSNLTTRDLEGAAAFYGAVFGWEVRSVDMGPMQATMLCLPGYGDFLETLEPGVRDRQEGTGAPEGFADAIGWVDAMSDDDVAAGVPSHWAVTFTASDTAAVATRAEELGGTVVVPPVEMGPVVSATLADPFGTVFSINSFDPDALTDAG